jgi:NAD(P)-dependent dehydrogenase (short-subunit alcohol dehydrogenase family)
MDVSASTLEGKRILVVGASSGIGRAFALRAVQQGAHVVVSARRAGHLAELIREAGGGVAITGDVRIPADCERIAAEAAATLGSIDLLLYTVGAAPLRRFADTTADDWRAVLETNLVGPHQVIRAALGSFAPGALVAVLSSEAVGRPYVGLGAYVCSKAALEESLRMWRTERPELRVCCVTQGASMPTDFGSAFDLDLLGEVMQEWGRLGVASGVMNTDDVVGVMTSTFAAALANPGVGLEHIVLRPPSAVAAPLEMSIDMAREQYS